MFVLFSKPSCVTVRDPVGPDAVIISSQIMVVVLRLLDGFMVCSCCARCVDPDGFIDDILASNFSMSLIRQDGGIAALDKAALLALPRDGDRMLLLERG